MQAYCVKCKKKQPMNAISRSAMKYGRVLLKSACPDCGKTICLITSEAQAQAVQGDA